MVAIHMLCCAVDREVALRDGCRDEPATVGASPSAGRRTGRFARGREREREVTA
jgi:hypothetical protein